MKFDKNNHGHLSWLSNTSTYDFLDHFKNTKLKLRIYARLIELMHDKPMTKESIDTVIEYIRECGR